jgi:dUTP pyrophosphatase
MLNVKFSKLHPDAIIPSYAKPGDAGLDLTAVGMNYVRTDETDFYEYDIGLAVEIPVGYVGLIFPRSSITKTDLILSNCVGVVDSGYRGRLSARFRKTTGSPHVYKVGDRIAQMVIIPFPQIKVLEVSYDELTKTERGIGGFGSSGR